MLPKRSSNRVTIDWPKWLQWATSSRHRNPLRNHVTTIKMVKMVVSGGQTDVCRVSITLVGLVYSQGKSPGLEAIIGHQGTFRVRSDK